MTLTCVLGRIMVIGVDRAAVTSALSLALRVPLMMMITPYTIAPAGKVSHRNAAPEAHLLKGR